MMPPGLLNTLSDEDILDMLAYVISMGDPQNPLFEKSGLVSLPRAEPRPVNLGDSCFEWSDDTLQSTSWP